MCESHNVLCHHVPRRTALAHLQKMDSFDKLPQIPDVGLAWNLTQDLDGPGIYDQLSYVTRKFPGISYGVISGVEASSRHTVALVVRPAKGSLKAIKDGGYIKLEQVYFGCTTVNLQALIGVQLPCTVISTAYNSAGHVLKLQNIEYKPKFEKKDRLVSKMLSVPVDLPDATQISVSGNILPVSTDQFQRICGLPRDKLSADARNATDKIGTIAIAVLFDDIKHTLCDYPQECQH